MSLKIATTAITAFLIAGSAHAALITEGFTFAVASAGGNTATGTHFHSNTGGAFGNPAGKAEVGRFISEEVRGLSEYDLTGLTMSPTAFVTFNVFKEGGLFNGANDTPFTGTIRVVAYQGNNAENISDYQAAVEAVVGSFAVDPASVDVGDIYSFDIGSIFNAAISNGWTSLGIRLEQSPLLQASQAWTFDSFRLTTDNLTTDVPEPSALAILGLGLVAAGIARRRR